MKQKNGIFWGALFILAIGVLVLGESFGPPPPPPVASILTYSWAQDTITNTEADTLLSSAVLSDVQKNYIYCWSIKRTSVSGTINVALKLEESNVRTGGTTGWVSIATGAGTAAVPERITGADFYGRRQRLILTGTGTEVTHYNVSLTMKLKN